MRYFPIYPSYMTLAGNPLERLCMRGTAVTNWYVVQVQSGREETMASEIRKKVGSDVVEECFVPRWETQTKVHHVWRFVRRNLIPGLSLIHI